MKRIVTFTEQGDGRKLITSISAPVREEDIKEISSTMGLISSNFIDPVVVAGKRTQLYYNPETELVEVEYLDIQFEDLDPISQIKVLKAENEALHEKNTQLEEENLVTQDAVMEMYELMLGGEI